MLNPSSEAPIILPCFGIVGALTLLRLAFSTVALRRERSAAVAKPSRSNINVFARDKFSYVAPIEILRNLLSKIGTGIEIRSLALLPGN
jgi:hypothetical protein